MHRYLLHSEPAVIFTLAVCAVAVGFGSGSALWLSVMSAMAYNLCVVPPEMAFTVPQVEEFLYLLVNVIISVGLPMIVRGSITPPKG
jgi:K+-sensing histidine kinase KdpD